MSIPCEYRKLGYGFDLPPGYRQCEYIESTGTQWLDFEWYANGGMLCKLKGIWSPTFNDGLVGSHDAYNNAGPGYNRNYLDSKGTNSSMELGIAGTYRSFTVPNNYKNGTTVLEAEFNTRPGTAYVKAYDQILIQWNNSTVLAPRSTVTAFRDNYALRPCTRGRLYYCTIIDVNDVVVRDLVPCLDYNGVPGMFDKITGKTFYNKGTGTFSYKPKPFPFPNGYTELEYIESTGTQYIDTEVKASYLGEWVLDAQLTNISIKSCQINGVYTAGDISMDIGTYQNCWLLKNGGYAWMDSTKRAHDTFRHKFVLSQIDKFGSIDGEVYVNSNCYVDVSKYPNLGTVWLFNRNSPNGEHYLCYEKIYSSTMKNRDGVLIQNLLPYLDPVGVPCMVDVLTGKTFYNQGTGTFSYKIKD